MALAEERVVDRFGGTHLASSLRELLVSRHGNAVRGGVLVIASDGWDSDDPEDLAAVMARLSRRARRVVWLNPRAAAPGFEPRVGSMAAALPYCDAFLPATPCGRCPRSSTRSPGSAPEGDVHRRLEPAQSHAGAAHHRLDRARRGEEANQLRRPPAAAVGREASADQMPCRPRRRPSTGPGGRREVAGHPKGRARRHPATPLGLLEGGGVALEDPLVPLGHGEGAEDAGDDAAADGGRGRGSQDWLAQLLGGARDRPPAGGPGR